MTQRDLAFRVLYGHLVDRRLEPRDPAENDVTLATLAHLYPLVRDYGARIAAEIVVQLIALRLREDLGDAGKL